MTMDFKCDVLCCPEKKSVEIFINGWNGKWQPYIESAIAFSNEELQEFLVFNGRQKITLVFGWNQKLWL